MKYLSDSRAVIVDIRLDYGETFKRTFYFYDSWVLNEGEFVSGTLKDMTYWDAEIRIFYEKQDKLNEIFNLDNNKLQYIATGTYQVSEDLTIKAGNWKWEFLLIDPNGVKIIPYKGDFIYDK